jgi:hypothetical protein
MYRVVVNSTEDLQKVLSINDMEYADIYLSTRSCTIVNYSSAMLGLMKLSLKKNDGYAIQFRMERKLLEKLAVEGYIDFTINDTTITAEFVTQEGRKLYDITFAKQNVYALEYQNEIEILKEVEKSPDCWCSLEPLSRLATVARSSNCVLTVENKVACVQITDHMKLWADLEGFNIPNMSVQVGALLKLLKLNLSVFNYKNFVGTVRGNVTLMCKKVRGFNVADFKLAREQKSALKCKIDLSELTTILAKLTISDKIVTINLSDDGSNGFVSLTIGHSRINVPIGISEFRKADTYAVEPIEMPMFLLKTILTKTKPTFFLSKKRSFIELEQDNLVVMF